MKVLTIKGRLYTKNLVPGQSVYEERLMNIRGVEYREWEPKRSKLGAGLKKGVKNPLKEDSNVLYLGAASGTTVSHVSDLVINGRVFAVEFAPEPMKKLVLLAKKRQNIIPIFANANKPDEYKDLLEKCDVVFQDIAQKNQVEIFVKNCKKYLKRNGIGILSLKSRSVDVTKKPWTIFKIVEKELRQQFHVIKNTRLEPFEKDHMLFMLKWK